MNKNFKCVIFDLDGTIINSGPDLLDALNFVLHGKGLQKINSSVIGNLVGGGAEAMIRKGYSFLNKKIFDNDIKLMVKDFIDYYSKNCSNKTKIYSGTRATLSYLKKKNIIICLCTNKRETIAKKILEKLNLDHFFDFVIGSKEGVPLKPDPYMLDYCMKKFSVKPNETTFVGDSDNDILPANNLGIYSVYVNYGYGKLNEKIIPKLTLSRISDLKQIF